MDWQEEVVRVPTYRRTVKKHYQGLVSALPLSALLLILNPTLVDAHPNSLSAGQPTLTELTRYGGIVIGDSDANHTVALALAQRYCYKYSLRAQIIAMDTIQQTFKFQCVRDRSTLSLFWELFTARK